MKALTWLVNFFCYTRLEKIIHDTGENRHAISFYLYIDKQRWYLSGLLGEEEIFCVRSGGLYTHLNMSLLFLKKQLGIKAFRENKWEICSANILPSTCQRFYSMTLHPPYKQGTCMCFWEWTSEQSILIEWSLKKRYRWYIKY